MWVFTRRTSGHCLGTFRAVNWFPKAIIMIIKTTEIISGFWLHSLSPVLSVSFIFKCQTALLFVCRHQPPYRGRLYSLCPLVSSVPKFVWHRRHYITSLRSACCTLLVWAGSRNVFCWNGGSLFAKIPGEVMRPNFLMKWFEIQQTSTCN